MGEKLDISKSEIVDEAEAQTMEEMVSDTIAVTDTDLIIEEVRELTFLGPIECNQALVQY
jgi:hypothetical protein